MKELMRVEDLTKWFPVRRGFLSSVFGGKEQFLRAVDGVSFDIADGEILDLSVKVDAARQRRDGFS